MGEIAAQKIVEFARLVAAHDGMEQVVSLEKKAKPSEMHLLHRCVPKEHTFRVLSLHHSQIVSDVRSCRRRGVQWPLGPLLHWPGL